ncbi:TOTE conflict system archaeo-eukaryotic primase domain-containing protein [Alkaliphilus pronyensis]
MFAGRKDVYAKRWSSKKGNSGYSPVCFLIKIQCQREVLET